MYQAEIEKLIEKAAAKRAKEVQKIEKRNAALGDYKTEDDIVDAYGYDNITAKERDQLLDDLRASKEAGQSALDEPTALTEYLRMLRQDKANMQIEIKEFGSMR